MKDDATIPERREVWWALGYFAVYMAYNFVAGGENEMAHWLTLVALPTVGLFVLRLGETGPRPFGRRVEGHGEGDHLARRGGDGGVGGAAIATLASIGLQRGNLRTGVAWAIAIGLGISVLQSLGRMGEVLELVRSGKALLIYPLVVGLLFLTAGFTEEVLFRGVLQTRLHRATGSAVVAILVTAVLFSIYHLPYAYLKWNSAGDWGAAFQSAFTNGMLGGVVLGVIFLRAKHNLLATVIVHTLINSVPAMTIVKFGGSGG